MHPVPAAPTVRVATPGDHDALGELVVAAYRTVPGFGELDPDLEDELADVAAKAGPFSQVAVAVDEVGAVLGGVLYVADRRSRWAEHDDAGAASFRHLAVDPVARGTGVGRALVRWCVDQARREHKERLIIHTTRHMTEARRLYERAGFARSPDLDWEPEPGFVLLGYRLELEATDPRGTRP